MTRERPKAVSRWQKRAFALSMAGLAAGLVALLVLPIFALVVTASPADILAGFRHPVAVPALLLSLVTTAISLLLVLLLGTPLAWWLASAKGRLAHTVETLVALPVVIPPAVAGIALLLTFGRRGLFGPALALGRAGRSRSAPRRWCWRRCSSRRRFTCRARPPRSAGWIGPCWWWRARWAPRRRGSSFASPCRWPGPA